MKLPVDSNLQLKDVKVQQERDAKDMTENCQRYRESSTPVHCEQGRGGKKT